MADTYPNFAALEQHEDAGVDYQIRLRRDEAAFAVVAPHGGGIEPGTSEIADAIAGDAHSFYAFEGLKANGNGVLHITSTHFDEPMCLSLVGRSAVVITIHGESSMNAGEVVFLGGRDADLGARIGVLLARRGFDVRTHDDPGLQGKEKKNICNRGTSGAGVQLELSRGLRAALFESLTTKGREHPTAKFARFVDGVRRALRS